MHKRPLAVIAVFFIIGIVLARFLPDSVKFFHIFVVTLSFILFSFVFSSRRAGLNLPYDVDRVIERAADIFLLLSIVFFAGLLYLNCNAFSSSHITHFLKEGPLNTSIVGIVKGPALTRQPYYGKIASTYLFEMEGIKIVDKDILDEGEWLNVTGFAQIRIQTEKDYKYGDRLLVKGTIKRPHLSTSVQGEALNKTSNRNSQGFALNFNYREYLERQNIFAIINTKEANVALLSHDYKSNPILKYIYSFRERLKNQIIEKMPLESGAFMRAILLGDRSELPKYIQASFKNSGTMHILAISGLHVGLIASVIINLLRFLRVKREISYIFTILFLIFFGLFTLSRPSVVRAVVMVCVFLVGMLLGRKTDAYNSLGIAALFILIRNPKDLFDVGFQLSFLAVLSIIYIVPKGMRLIKDVSNFYLRKYLYTPLLVSIAASLGTSPLILYYFRIVTPIAIISNLFIIPVLFVSLMGGLGFLLLGWIGIVGTILAGFNNLLVCIIFFLADFFASLKFGHFYLW